jgi:plasmid stabilization system protein ParE
VIKRLRIHRLAEDELADAAVWYEGRRSGLGVGLLDLVDNAVGRIKSGVLSGSIVPGLPNDKSARRIVLRRYPYSIVFYENEDEIVIIAFAHSSRIPGYWLSRQS